MKTKARARGKRDRWVWDGSITSLGSTDAPEENVCLQPYPVVGSQIRHEPILSVERVGGVIMDTGI